MPAETLESFLERKRETGSGKFTHTSMGSTPKDLGKYFIGEDDLPEFYSLYSDFIEVEGGKIWLIEAPSALGPMRVDLDFAYDQDFRKNQHTQEQLVAFTKAYVGALRTFVEVPPTLDVYVMEKKRPTPKRGGLFAGGVHIMIPTIQSTKHVEKAVRDMLLTKMEDIFGSLPLKEKEWDKVYDKGIANRSVGWTMYGARKPEGLPYLVSYILRMTPDDIEVVKGKHEASANVLKLLCTRTLDMTRETPLTAQAKDIFGDLPETSENVRISGGGAVKPSRGRPAERRIGGSRDSSPNHATLRVLGEEERAYYRSHVQNLADTRSEDYHDWETVGQCLKNIHPDLYDEFEDFSRRSAKFNLRECMRQWNSFSYRNDGPKVNVGSLLHWSRIDNPDGYKEIQENNILKKIDASIAGTEYDVASVVYAKFHDTYKCVSFGKNVWFKFAGHVWHELDRGIQLQQELSTEIWKIYKKRAQFWGGKLTDGSIQLCSAKIREECMCEFCTCAIKEDSFGKVCTKLKTTKYKENVMKECRELFLDEDFIKKVDENRHLLACRNGIFDMKTLEFRDGKQEDYMSFSTGLDVEDLHYAAYPAWQDVSRFIEEVLPNRTVRDYTVRHLAFCLSGVGNQRFHILTGSGSNGKSMLMNLVETALGDYACKVPISMITQGRNKSSSASPEVVRLKGRRFVTMQEPDESVPLNTGLMKEITSSEKILCRDLYAGSKSMIEFELQCKFHLACNEKPKVNSTDGGTWRRLVVVNFMSKFVANPGPGQFRLDLSIEQKVKTEAWGKAFLAYLIHVYKDSVGKDLSPPDAVLEYTNEYREENDAITKFVREVLRPVVADEVVIPVRKETVTDAFRTWWEANRGSRDWRIPEMLKTVETAFGKYQRGGWKTFQIQQDDE